ncbi:MAG: bifunctional 2-polyprenyl-6-hydroxyphenol methylase/3-demethylubiquinol 3-O-methyltransferase UbiG [Micavibrio sp.]|nr:bifunctional 2-polyprenyl-6-hydroxyphenol methylase/3-demethylubiquinol 3-O-methyltransferase UbiG [Micavibrio sp.]
MSSIDRKEIENFSKDAAKWWDANGPFKPLHRLNPVRLGFIKAQICNIFARDAQSMKALEGLKILDIGCGGGLVCEPLARMGAKVTGVDADQIAVETAQNHAAKMGLSIDYKCAAAENLAQQFDVVLALEIIEHVDNPAAFVDNVAKLAKPDGLVIFSTLNRNPKSFALGIIAAEYLLRWVPRGTHSWKKFVKPSELTRMARASALSPIEISGLIFDPLKDEFRLSKSDMDVNYLIAFKK